MKVTNGRTVRVHYRGFLPEEDNVEFDSSHSRGEPVEFTAGSGRMIPGFENATFGLEEGETTSVTLSPEEAYGPNDPNARQVVPKTAFGEGFDFRLNGMIQGNGAMGPFMARIHEIREEEVVLDFNHPLAGKTLHFEIQVVSVSDEPQLSGPPDAPIGNWSASMKKAELLEIAKSHGLNVNTRSTKAQIIDALKA